MVMENYRFPVSFSKNYINTFWYYMNCRFLTTNNKKEGGGTGRKEEKKPNFYLYLSIVHYFAKKKP